jgi:hypothetical protein
MEEYQTQQDFLFSMGNGNNKAHPMGWALEISMSSPLSSIRRGKLQSSVLLKFLHKSG